MVYKKKINCISLVQVVASLSLIIGILYLPSPYAIPVLGLGHELLGAMQLTKLWAMYAILGGAVLLISTFLMKLSWFIAYKRIFLIIFFTAILIFIMAQFFPLLWWIIFSILSLSWFSVIGIVLHLGAIIYALLTLTVTSYTISKLKRN